MILSKTHYGLNIFSSILRQYYPGETVLSISGRDCKPAKNPFNNNKPTLLISVVGGKACYLDSDQSLPNGDVFDFATLHYGMEGQALLDRIVNDLYLKFHDSSFMPWDKDEQNNVIFEPKKKKVKIPEFSYYSKPVTNVFPNRTINLVDAYNLIKGTEFNTMTTALRQFSDAKDARKYKAANFNYVTFSGVFSSRKDDALIKHSGLLTIDFDHIANIGEFKTSLLDDEYFDTELLFISPSGDGLKWIITIDITAATHQDYFQACANYIEKTYSIKVDKSGRDCSRACFLPYDPEVFINSKYLL